MKKANLKILLFITIYTLIFYYIIHPAIHISSPVFWLFIISICIVYTILKTVFFFKDDFLKILLNNKWSFKKKKAKYLFIVPILILIIMLVNFILSPVFNAKAYYKRIAVDTTGNFNEEVKEADFNKLPLLDRASTEKIGDRTMGQMSELVSQFDVSSEYTQINYNNEILRVTPLEYNGFIKWITNRKNGIKAYITVNSTTGNANLIKLDKGMKYAPSAYFNENLYRKLQFSYPTKIFGEINFEIDNEGNPYWVASTLKYSGVGLKEEVNGVVIFDPITGKSKYYKTKDIPSWVDNVYAAELILDQVNCWGKYKNGFLNSLISQKEVVVTTEGYNYLAQDDDIYLYTGITSVISDESNIGFILTNLRTKSTKFYNVAGAEEYSAMDSAEGQVQQMKYTSTFPLLINLENRPTYLVSLKDNAGLVKMYGFVDVVDYQKVVVTDSSKGIETAKEAYLNELVNSGGNSNYQEKEIIISNLNIANIDGTTYYYFTDQDNQKYKVSIKVNSNLPFIKNNDKILIKYNKITDIITIKEVIC